MPPPTTYAKADSQTVLTTSDFNQRRPGDLGRSYSTSSSENKANMDMEIQPVPWWNRRSRMERRFIMLAVILLCVTVGLAVALTGVMYQNYEHNQAVNQGNVDLSHQTTAAFTAQEPDQARPLAPGLPTNYCMTKGCVKTAADILANMDESVSPCHDFYQFACGGFMERTSIPDDRTRVSSFSVLGDELLTQVSTYIRT